MKDKFKKINEPKMKPCNIKGISTLHEETRCNIGMLRAYDEKLERLVMATYSGLRDAHLICKKCDFSPDNWGKDAEKMLSMVEMIVSEDSKKLSLQKKTDFLIEFQQQAQKCVFDLYEPKGPLTMFSYFLFKIKKVVDLLPSEYIVSAENAYNYSSNYFNLLEQEQDEIAGYAQRARLNLKKLKDIQILATDAFELEKYKNVRKPIVRMHNTMVALKRNFEEYDQRWNGLLSRMLEIDDKKGIDFISYFIKVDRSNIAVLEDLIKFEVEIPQIKKLEKKYPKVELSLGKFER